MAEILKISGYLCSWIGLPKRLTLLPNTGPSTWFSFLLEALQESLWGREWKRLCTTETLRIQHFKSCHWGLYRQKWILAWELQVAESQLRQMVFVETVSVEWSGYGHLLCSRISNAKNREWQYHFQEVIHGSARWWNSTSKKIKQRRRTPCSWSDFDRTTSST